MKLYCCCDSFSTSKFLLFLLVLLTTIINTNHAYHYNHHISTTLLPIAINKSFRYNSALFGTRKSWSQSDLDILVNLRHNGLSFEEIGRKLTRTGPACHTMYQKLRTHLSFTQDEQKMILDAIIIHGENWEMVASSTNLKATPCETFYLHFLRNLNTGPWNEQEDEQLLSSCSSLSIGEVGNWRNISHTLLRTSMDCRRRYYYLVLGRDTSKMSDVWYESEVNRLFELKEKWGTTWRAIGRELGRNEMQCYNKFFYNKVPLIEPNPLIDEVNNITNSSVAVQRVGNRREVWTTEEDIALRALWEKYRNKWVKISAELGRPPNHCCQRWAIININGTKGWTNEQKAELADMVTKYGAKWTFIGKKLRKSPMACHTAYRRMVAKSVRSGKLALSMPRAKDAKNKVPSLDIAQGVRPWCKEEDQVLKGLIAKYGQQWDVIAEAMGRSPEDVNWRFDFKISARRWSREDNKRLVELVGKLGRKWVQIAALMGRTEAQCGSRYLLQLDPRLKFNIWSEEEKERLLSLRDDLGYNYDTISYLLQRTGPSCRYRYEKLKAVRK